MKFIKTFLFLLLVAPLVFSQQIDWNTQIKNRPLDTLTTVGNIPRVSASGILGLSKLSCTLGTCTVYDDTATTGVTTLVVRAGAGQASASLQEWKNAGGATIAYVDSVGGLITNAYVTALGGNLITAYSVYPGFTGGGDLSLSRTSAGRLQINSGTSGNWGTLDVSTVALRSLTAPGAPTVTPTCVSGCTQTWTYKIVALDAAGNTTAAGSAGSTAVQNATLDGSNYNALSWTAVTGATSYDIYMTASGGTPATTGKIVNVTTNSYQHVGANGDGGTAPTTNGTGTIVWATDGGGNIGINGGNRPASIFTSDAIYSGASVFANSGYYFGWYSGTLIGSPSDGVLKLTDWATTSFDRVQLGGTTSSFPALKRVGTAVAVRQADDTVGTYSTLPTCNAAAEGSMAPVTDSNTATWGASVAGGSTNHILAYCNGTAWTVMAK